MGGPAVLSPLPGSVWPPRRRPCLRGGGVASVPGMITRLGSGSVFHGARRGGVLGDPALLHDPVMRSGTRLPDWSQIAHNTIGQGERFTVDTPGHLLYLTNGAIRICHWTVRCGEWDLDAFIGYVAEHYPHRIRLGIEPDAPYEPCPFYEP